MPSSVFAAQPPLIVIGTSSNSAPGAPAAMVMGVGPDAVIPPASPPAALGSLALEDPASPLACRLTLPPHAPRAAPIANPVTATHHSALAIISSSLLKDCLFSKVSNIDTGAVWWVRARSAPRNHRMTGLSRGCARSRRSRSAPTEELIESCWGSNQSFGGAGAVSAVGSSANAFSMAAI